MSIYRSETLKHQHLNANNFCLENFYTIRYNTFLHTFYSAVGSKFVLGGLIMDWSLDRTNEHAQRAK